MAAIKSGVSKDALTIDTTSKAARLTLYGSTGLEQSYEQKATFGLTFSIGSAASGAFAPLPSVPTDLIALTGSKNKIVKLVSFAVATTNAIAMSLEYYLLKRYGTAYGSGDQDMAVRIGGVPLDSQLQPTATAVHWPATISPDVLGNLVGNINIKRVAAPVTIPTSWAGITRDNRVEMLPAIGPSILDSPLTLRGVNEYVVLNLNGVSLPGFGVGMKILVSIIWTEE